jgi:hypothetical protein
MSALVVFILANKALFAALGVAILSELAPFLPTRANGIVHMVVLMLSKAAPSPAVVPEVKP